MIHVALEHGNDRRGMVYKSLRETNDFFDALREKKRILIKVNLVHHELQLASTHVDAVRGVLDAIRQVTGMPVVIGDGAYHGTPAAFRHFGYDRLVDEYEQVSLVDLNEGGVRDGHSIRADGGKNAIRRADLAHEVDFRISLTPMKMDQDVAVSLSVKNWVMGTWIVPPRISASGRVWARWPWMHEEGIWAQHATISSLFQQLPCDWAVVDGVLAMQGDGPVRGTAIEGEVVLSGGDPVAVDAVAATLMGVDPGDVGYLSMLAEADVGAIDLGTVNVPPMMMAQLTRVFERPVWFEDRLGKWRNAAISTGMERSLDAARDGREN